MGLHAAADVAGGEAIRRPRALPSSRVRRAPVNLLASRLHWKLSLALVSPQSSSSQVDASQSFALILHHPLEQVQFVCRCSFSCSTSQTAMAGFSHLNFFTELKMSKLLCFT